MNPKTNQKGFTLIEILVALGIMAIGFLAMSQMQYLSVLQTQRASDGTLATNIIQFAADNDMQNLKRMNLLNSRVYLNAQAQLPFSTTPDYCDGTAPSSCPEAGDLSCQDPCQTCPCDPISELFGVDTTQDDTETSCAVIDNIEEFDLTKLRYEENFDNCVNGIFYLVRNINSDFIQNLNPTIEDELIIDITYGLKTPRQFRTNQLRESFTIKDSVAIQTVRLTGQIATDWDEVIVAPNWARVVVPNIP